MKSDIQKPLDAQLAAWLVRPLARTVVRPSHLTSIRLAVGMAAALFFSLGPDQFILGSCLFALSHFLDHTDGELARVTGKTSRFGHYYDLWSDLAVTISLFLGIGIGLLESRLGSLAPALGGIAGVAVSLTFWLHLEMSNRLGARAELPKTSLFEMEDILYLVPVVAMLGGIYWFLLAASIGAPLFAIWLYFQFLKVSVSENVE